MGWDRAGKTRSPIPPSQEQRSQRLALCPVPSPSPAPVGVGAELGGMGNELTMTRSRELKLEIRLSESHTQTKILLVPWCIKHQGEKREAAGVGSNCMLPTSVAMRPIALG